MNYLNKIVALLVENKKFPNYQAERRIDIFLNVILEDLLSVYLNEEVKYVCPEFALRQDGDYNRSTKLDYLCKTKSEIIFIELKTDNHSFNEDQLKTYFTESWGNWLEKLNQIINATTDKVKYSHLKRRLSDFDLYNDRYKDAKIRVIYISPKFSMKDINKLQEIGFTLNKLKMVSEFKEKTKIPSSDWDIFSPLFTIDGEELALFELNKNK